MVDTYDSKSYEGNLMRVQVSPTAPIDPISRATFVDPKESEKMAKNKPK